MCRFCMRRAGGGFKPRRVPPAVRVGSAARRDARGMGARTRYLAFPHETLSRRCGASSMRRRLDFLSKRSDMAQTFIAVKTILPGDLFFPADAASALCRDRAREAPAGSGGLTDREPTVLRHSAGIRAGRFFYRVRVSKLFDGDARLRERRISSEWQKM